MKRNPKSFDLLSSYSYYLPGVGEMFILLMMLLLGMIAGNLLVLLAGIFMPGDFAGQFGMLVAYPVMFIPAMLYASGQSRRNMFFDEAVPLDMPVGGWKNWLAAGIAVSVVTLAAAFLYDPVGRLMPPMPESLEAIMENMMHGSPLWATLLSVSVFAPFFEEWLCRGMVLRGLLGRMNPVWAIVISSLFFAVIHMNPWQALPAFLIGLLFGYVYYRTRSLKLTMLMHCANNTFATLTSQVGAWKDAESFAEVMSPEAYLGTLSASAALLLAFILLSVRYGRKSA